MRAAAYFAVVSALALWAGNWIVARAVRDDIAPALITSGRVVLVMAVLAPFALPGLAARLRAFVARDWAVLGGLGVFGGGLHNAMQYLGLQYTTATNGTLFFSLSPVTILMLAGLMLGERIRAMQWIGVAVSFAGVLVIALRGEAEALATLSFNPGDILCFVSMIFWSGYTIFLRLQRTALEPIQLLFMVCAVGLLTLLPWLAWDLAYDPRAHFNWRGTAALLLLRVRLGDFGLRRLELRRIAAGRGAHWRLLAPPADVRGDLLGAVPRRISGVVPLRWHGAHLRRNRALVAQSFIGFQ